MAKPLAFSLLFSLSTAACLSACSPYFLQTENQPNQIMVSSAISLKDVLGELAASFEKAHPGTKVVFNFGASGQLAQQIEQGAPSDLFISAATEPVDRLAKKGLISAPSVHECASNKMVVISQNLTALSSMKELLKVQRLAIGNPKSVPAGAYAEEALRKAGIYEALVLSGKLVFAENARQILSYVEDADVDAGIVYSTDALLAKKSKICFTIAKSDTKPMIYEVALMEKSAGNILAQQFLELVISSEAKASFRKRGFSS